MARWLWPLISVAYSLTDQEFAAETEQDRMRLFIITILQLNFSYSRNHMKHNSFDLENYKVHWKPPNVILGQCYQLLYMITFQSFIKYRLLRKIIGYCYHSGNGFSLLQLFFWWNYKNWRHYYSITSDVIPKYISIRLFGSFPWN